MKFTWGVEMSTCTYTEELKSCNLRFPLISAEKKVVLRGFFYVSNEMVGNEFVY